MNQGLTWQHPHIYQPTEESQISPQQLHGAANNDLNKQNLVFIARARFLVSCVSGKQWTVNLLHEARRDLATS